MHMHLRVIACFGILVPTGFPALNMASFITAFSHDLTAIYEKRENQAAFTTGFRETAYQGFILSVKSYFSSIRQESGHIYIGIHCAII